MSGCIDENLTVIKGYVGDILCAAVDFDEGTGDRVSIFRRINRY